MLASGQPFKIEQAYTARGNARLRLPTEDIGLKCLAWGVWCKRCNCIVVVVFFAGLLGLDGLVGAQEHTAMIPTEQGLAATCGLEVKFLVRITPRLVVAVFLLTTIAIARIRAFSVGLASGGGFYRLKLIQLGFGGAVSRRGDDKKDMNMR